MAKPSKRHAQAFVRDVCRSIRENEFEMTSFKRGSVRTLPTCGTAQCKAGHIIAVRRDRAKELMLETPEEFTTAIGPDFENLAARIWEDETGRACELDFHEFGQTRAEALKEIRTEALS